MAMSTAARNPTVRATDLSTKRDVARVFFSLASPRIITAAVVCTVGARLLWWSWSIGDLIVIGGVLAFTGPLEWAIHKLLLHSHPASFPARTFGAGVSHRKHHLDPPELEYLVLSGLDAAAFTLLLGLASVVWALPLLMITGSAVALPMLTAIAATCVGFANYEWTHLLVHTRYRPTTRLYSRLARNHRLHHFRNEQHWLGVTSNLGDRLAGTLPRHKSDVVLSTTARTLE